MPDRVDTHSQDWKDGYETGFAEGSSGIFNPDGSYRDEKGPARYAERTHEDLVKIANLQAKVIQAEREADAESSSAYVQGLLADAYHRGFVEGEGRTADMRKADIDLIRKRNRQLTDIRAQVQNLLGGLPEARDLWEAARR